MKTTTRHALIRGLLALLLAGSAAVGFAQVAPPAKREATVAAARKLLEPKDATLPAKVADPFHPGNFGSTAAQTQTTGGEQTVSDGGASQTDGQRSGRGLLVTIANSIKPSGYFVIGGSPTLVFGQKRVKAGEFLTINFEGKDYNLEVTAIDRTSFTLRLNNEAYTRPIK